MKQSFIRCGLTGLFMEIFFTGMDSLLHQDFTLTGHSSILMFPIYGAAAVFGPLSRRLQGRSFLLRGGIYTICIFLMEFLSGALLRQLHICPWDYSADPTNIAGLVRLDYAPFWFLAGLLLERIACLPEIKPDRTAAGEQSIETKASPQQSDPV